jgi:hypothetical protein
MHENRSQKGDQRRSDSDVPKTVEGIPDPISLTGGDCLLLAKCAKSVGEDGGSIILTSSVSNVLGLPGCNRSFGMAPLTLAAQSALFRQSIPSINVEPARRNRNSRIWLPPPNADRILPRCDDRIPILPNHSHVAGLQVKVHLLTGARVEMHALKSAKGDTCREADPESGTGWRRQARR